MERSICIHGHFYQPPRENPWLEDIELQDSAYPYHDWNERVTAECYEPNTASRILDGDGWIRNIVNNYARISFNFGPTLLSWMEKKEPEVYRAIIEADLQSRKKFSGHGSAFAQAYNHMILPLANGRDRYTQVVWGIKDFEHRFGRKPEGMWLPETAVDLETLKIMAEQGIKFTVLANYQVKRVRKIDGGEWRDVLPGGADTKMPYVVHLPGTDKTISVFLYDGEVARVVAFEKLLYSGEHFAQRLAGAFDDRREPQLVHVATDGETYGHHHRHGDMALAYALDLIETKGPARLTNYAAYLEQHLPTYEAEINEYTSWSCFHGVERWRNDCGYNSGMHPGWNQAWPRPLRDALDWLRDHLAPQYEEKAARYLKDPWEARNAYIEIILDRSRDNVTRWIEEHAARNLDPGERITVLKLLELQHHAMLMYTSCGWFFDEISGIETVQVIKYAARVVQLARELFGTSPEPRFLEILAGAGSNIPQFKDGANIYHRLVKPAMVDLLKVGAHYAICSLFESYDDHSRIYCYNVHRENYQISLAGRATLSLGRVRVTSEITHKSAPVVYGVVYFGNHNTGGDVRYFQGHLPPAVQRGLPLPGRRGAGPLPCGPRDYRPLRIAPPAGEAGQPARVRRHRPDPGERGPGGRGRLRPAGGGTATAPDGPVAGHRPQPYGREQREPLVAGRPAERPRLVLRGPLRYRLAASPPGAARLSPAPRPRGAPRPRPGKRGGQARAGRGRPLGAYREHRMPLSPASFRRLAAGWVAGLRDALGPGHTAGAAMMEIVNRPCGDAAKSLWRLYATSPEIKAFLDENLRLPADDLDRLLAEQSYRLAYWRAGREELNYRRFFDVTDLAGVRMDDEEVFEATHALCSNWSAGERSPGCGSTTSTVCPTPAPTFGPSRDAWHARTVITAFTL